MTTSRLTSVIYMTRKRALATTYIPATVQIQEREIIKRTEKGYRLKRNSNDTKGSVYLDEHYNFFKNYEAALAFIAEEAKRIADELDEMRSRAIHLMNEAHDLLRNQASHLHITQ